MGRGKKVNIEEYIANIAEYLKVGCSLHEACLHGETPYRTVKDYYDNEDEVRKKIDRLMNTPILTARQTVVKDLEDNPDMAMKYLERKLKSEFSPRVEKTGADGGPQKMEIGWMQPDE